MKSKLDIKVKNLCGFSILRTNDLLMVLRTMREMDTLISIQRNEIKQLRAIAGALDLNFPNTEERRKGDAGTPLNFPDWF